MTYKSIYQRDTLIFLEFFYILRVKYSYEIHKQDQWQFSFSHIFSDSFIFGKATSSKFFRVTFFKVSRELLFWSSSFFRAAAFFEEILFQNSHFFSAYFSEQLLFQSKTSTEKSHLENRKFSCAVTFRNSYSQKISTEELLF